MTIYFIRKGDTGPIKIGYTAVADASKRMRQLQTGQEERLRLLGTIDGTMEDEKSIHYELRSYNLGGEWFKPISELMLTIEHMIAGNLPWFHCRTIKNKFALNDAHEWWGPIFAEEEFDPIFDEPIDSERDFRHKWHIINRVFRKQSAAKSTVRGLFVAISQINRDSEFIGPRYRAAWEGHWPIPLRSLPAEQ